ncbi:helix-turn-helix domain-containing protein [Pelagibius litoralis]|uniref:Helix-turn-helix domain-containing protein n=1 Tax=Pelagibius litoralis TaxID=374515 RepID=A0A967F097_9PROT|nr:helix-turn-helix domain-containing protein [Pelagibius litoralis]NIA70700.1 helix-turn-helix domain-containing protein [Pelagibius litoralis]
MTESAARASIAIVTYPDVQMSAVLGLGDLFTIANRNSRQSGGGVLSVTEVSGRATDDTDGEPFAAVILPPTLKKSRGRNEKTIHEWLRAQHAGGALMCSVCAGAFWLGHSGLLKGRPVTTHWLLEDEFRTAFPDTQVNAEHLLIDDNDIVTAGGLMAWLDMGLFIVNRWLGPQVVSDTARHLLIDPSGREQRNYRSFRPPLTHGDSVILALQHWLEGHVDNEVTVKAMAGRAHLSDRTFLRRFKAATGLTPNTYVQNLRIEKARGLLERTRIPVSAIGWNVGYQDPSAFSRVFRAATGLTAGEYRNRFGVVARGAVTHGLPS